MACKEITTLCTIVVDGVHPPSANALLRKREALGGLKALATRGVIADLPGSAPVRYLARGKASTPTDRTYGPVKLRHRLRKAGLKDDLP